MPPRAVDRPYGQLGPQCLAALETPRTVAEVAVVLGWSTDRARHWINHFRKVGAVRRVSVAEGQGRHPVVGRYQRVTL